MTLKQEINSWQFASCPTEEKGLCWRWTKEGLDTLVEHIKLLMNKGGKRGKGLVSHRSPSTANVHLMGKGGGVKVRSNPTQTPSNEGALPSANVRLKPVARKNLTSSSLKQDKSVEDKQTPEKNRNVDFTETGFKLTNTDSSHNRIPTNHATIRQQSRKKTLTPDQYSKLVDDIIATKKPIDEQLVDLLEALVGKVITVKK